MCTCGSNKNFNECCGDIISGKKVAKNPKELMRSRYSAYVKANGKYLVLSAIKENQYKDDAQLIEEFSTSVEWLKLDILYAEKNIVEFKAYYRDKDSMHVLHERSSFMQEDGKWKYKDGIIFNSKIERNESCPCGSGKKFKKCCAK